MCHALLIHTAQMQMVDVLFVEITQVEEANHVNHQQRLFLHVMRHALLIHTAQMQKTVARSVPISQAEAERHASQYQHLHLMKQCVSVTE